jgi:hypothetical protein
MKGKLPVKIPDIVIILLALGLTVFSSFAVYARNKGFAQVLIQGPERSWVFPLDSEETVRVRGVLGGDTVVRISEGKVWAESSPCGNQLCVNMGPINANSRWAWVACLPNNVLFIIEGSNDNEQVDSITR